MLYLCFSFLYTLFLQVCIWSKKCLIGVATKWAHFYFSRKRNIWTSQNRFLYLINSQPDLGWIRRLQQILGRKHQRNLHVSNILAYWWCKLLVYSVLLHICFLSWSFNLHFYRLSTYFTPLSIWRPLCLQCKHLLIVW